MLKFAATHPRGQNYLAGDRVGQIMILPYPEIEYEEVGELSDTERGSGGFGSTGTN
jgi:dUTP pyrophosphatase